MKIKNRYIKNLKKGGISFCGYPVQYSFLDYERILNKIKNKAKKISEILSIYTFGSINAAGISDLDLIFVLKEKSSLPYFLKRNFHDKDSKYLIFHPFFIVNENIMKNIKYVYPNSKFIRIYGKKIKMHNPTEAELKKIKTYLTSDVILRHFPVDYLYVLLSKRVNIRMCLVRLNALSHSFRVFYDISGIKRRSWNDFSERVSNLRKSWFRTKQGIGESELLGLLKDAVYVSTDFVSEFNAFLCNNKNNLIYTKKKYVLFRGNKNRISFIKGWGREKAISQMVNHFLKHKNFYSVLPISLLRQLCCYSSCKGILSRYIGKRLGIGCYQNNIEYVLKKRITVLNEQVEYANKLKHSHYPCFFPLGYKTEKGLKNKLILLYVVITNSSVSRKVFYWLRDISKFYFRPGSFR